MALVTRNLASFDDGKTTISYVYEDTTHIVQSVTLNSLPGETGTVTAQVVRRTDQAVLRTVSRAAGQGVQTTDLTGFNIQMLSVVGKGGGLNWFLPYDLRCSWSSQ